MLSGYWLALRTPVTRPCSRALPAHFDHGAASPALLTLSSIDPDASRRIGSSRGAAKAGVGDGLIARGVGDIGVHEAAAGVDEAVDFAAGERGDAAKGMNTTDEADFRLEDVADASHHFLIEQHVADLFVGAGADARLCFVF